MPAPSIFRRGLTFAELASALAFVVIAALGCLSPAQSDTFWALRAGEDIWRTGAVPLVDTYSYTAAGRTWPNHEWLWQALLYGCYWLGGFPLVAAITAALLTGAYAIAYRLMAGARRTRLAILAVGVTLGSIGWSLRPQVASLLLLSILLWLLVRARYWLLPPLFALWANLHGGVVLGAFLLLAALGFSVLADRRRLPRLALATGLALLATLVSPLGPGLWSYVFRWMLTARQTGVSEWDPLVLTSMGGIGFVLVALAFVVLVARRWRAVAAWPDRLLVLLALVLLAAAARAARNVTPFLLAVMPAVTRLAAATSAGKPGDRPARGVPATDHPQANLAILFLATVMGLTAVVSCWSLPIARLDWRPIGRAAVSAVASCGEPFYNSYEVGGIILWFVRGRRVFIDSRHDPYPPEFVIADREVEQGADPRGFFDRHGFRCAVMAADARLGSALRVSGWRPRYQDSRWLVLERPETAATERSEAWRAAIPIHRR
jgi:hypothetical protein